MSASFAPAAHISKTATPSQRRGSLCSRPALPARLSTVPRFWQLAGKVQKRYSGFIHGAAAPSEAVVVESDDAAVQEMIDFLKDDLNNLFTDEGVDASRYGEVVDFQDPITKYDSLDGYLFNIKMLRYVFNPEFILHGIWQSGPNDITSRWTMNMELTVNKISPFRKFWDPKLTFTGLSIYTMDPDTRKIVKHVDYWDAITDQKYLSLEAVGHLISQVTNVTRTPDLKGPEYTILKKLADYEIRQYAPYVVAEKPFSSGGDASSMSERRTAFQSLAKYIFGSNKEGTKMSMTTPVLSDDTTMQFVVTECEEGASSAPQPMEDDIALKDQPGGVFAALPFSGVATEEMAMTKQEELREKLVSAGLKPRPGYVTARYNDPSVEAMFRRNEVLIELQEFQLLEVTA